jgi:hypothetical protein
MLQTHAKAHVPRALSDGDNTLLRCLGVPSGIPIQKEPESQRVRARARETARGSGRTGEAVLAHILTRAVLETGVYVLTRALLVF